MINYLKGLFCFKVVEVESLLIDDDSCIACIICSNVISIEEPITCNSHDEDGMWQFLCDKKHSMDDTRIVSLEEVYALDPSISEVANMPCGCYINRKK